MRKKLVDGIKGVGLYSIVGGIDEELRDVGLPTSKIRSLLHKKIDARRRKNFGLARAPDARGRRKGRAKERVITGLSPPGGLVLAQLHLGSLQTEGSQEYFAAWELLVGPETLPS